MEISSSCMKFLCYDFFYAWIFSNGLAAHNLMLLVHELNVGTVATCSNDLVVMFALIRQETGR